MLFTRKPRTEEAWYWDGTPEEWEKRPAAINTWNMESMDKNTWFVITPNAIEEYTKDEFALYFEKYIPGVTVKPKKFVMPNLANATPSFLADEYGKLNNAYNRIKKMRELLSTALKARWPMMLDGEMNPTKMPEAEINGEAMKVTRTVSHRETISAALARELLTAEQVAKLTVRSEIVTLRTKVNTVDGKIDLSDEEIDEL